MHMLAITHLEELELDAAVRAYVSKRQLVEGRQQELHVRQERCEAAHVVVAQGRVQTGINTRLLK